MFAGAVAVGSLTDLPRPAAPPAPAVLTGDFHVHATPGDGALPVWEIQREAARRGLDVIAITNHDGNLALRIAQASGLLKPYPIVIPGQEVTASNFHLAAIGVLTVVSPRLPLRAAIDAIHAQGGVAIAAHPVRRSWLDDDHDGLSGLDGVEVGHPSILDGAYRGLEMVEFFRRVQNLKTKIAPIGSTDFHVGAPLGLCRTYVIVNEVSTAGVLDAIRRGHTVASGPGDRLIGADEHVAAIRAYLKPPQRPGFDRGDASPAIAALLSLFVFILSGRKRRQSP